MGYSYGYGYGHTWRGKKRRVAVAGIGGGSLLEGEANGFATDFTYPVDAQRIALKASGTNTYSAVNSFYTNAGTSPKMVYDAAGTLGWSPHNYVLQSQTFDSATWAKNAFAITADAIAAPNGLTEADACIPSAGAVSPFVNQAGVTTANGAANTISVYAKNGTLGTPWLEILISSGTNREAWFNLATGVKGTTAGSVTSSNMTAVGNGWYRCDMTFTAGAAGGTLYFALRDADGSGGGITTGDGVKPAFYLWGAQLNLGTVPTAYLPTTTAARFGLALDYDPVSHAAKGLLCEPQATNACSQSAAGRAGFLWNANGSTLTGGQADPAGGLEALRIVTTANLGLNVYTQAPNTIGSTYVSSMWCRGTAGQQIFFITNDSTHASDQTLVTFTGAWQRVSWSFVATSNSAYVAFELYNRSGGAHLSNVTFTIWGGQCEAGTVATSYIPTLGATVTRATDMYNCTPASIGYSATAGSWWLETYLMGGAADEWIIGSSTAASPMLYNVGGVTIRDGTQLYIPPGPAIANNVNKLMSAFTTGSRAITYNGQAPAADAGTVTNILTQSYIGFGSNSGGASTMRGYIRKLRYLPRRPSNAELQTMTTTVIPVNSILPVISGTPMVGQTLTATSGYWSESPTSYTYAWYWNSTLAGVGSTYTLLSIDLGGMMTCRVSATNSAGSSTYVTSNALGPVVEGGGAALLMDESDGWATDFLYATDAQRVTVKTAGSTLAYAVDSFYQNAGTSPKMVYDVNGMLRWSPHNTCLQSQTFDNASWTKNLGTVSANAIAAPDGTTTADAFIPNSGVVDTYLNASMAETNGAVNTFSIYMKKGPLVATDWVQVLCNSSAVAKWFNITTGVVGSAVTGTPVASSISDAGNGWYRLSISYNAIAGTEAVYLAPRTVDGGGGAVTGNGTSPCYYAWGAQMNRGAVATAYYLPTTTVARFGLALDYDPVTHAARGLLCEPAATNLLTRSQDLSFLNIEQGTATVDNQTGPDGLVTADTYTENTASGVHGGYGSTAVTANADYTVSRFYKMGTRRYATIGWSDGTNGAYAVYDLQSGVVGSSAAFGTGVLNSASIQALPSGWYRCILSGKHPSTTGYYTFYAANAATITPDGFGRQVFVGTSATLFHGHGQLEAGTVATSPIPTLAATVTRAQDGYNATPASINYSATAGSWWVDISLNSVGGGGTDRIIGYQDNGETPIYVQSATLFSLYDGSANFSKTVPSVVGAHKVISAFASADKAITADGLAPATNVAAGVALLTPGTSIGFGQGVSAGAAINGYIRKVRYLPRRPNNAEMQTMTT